MRRLTDALSAADQSYIERHQDSHHRLTLRSHTPPESTLRSSFSASFADDLIAFSIGDFGLIQTLSAALKPSRTHLIILGRGTPSTLPPLAPLMSGACLTHHLRESGSSPQEWLHGKGSSGSSGSTGASGMRRSSHLGGALSLSRSRRTVPPCTVRSRGRTGLGVPPWTTGRTVSSQWLVLELQTSPHCGRWVCIFRGMSPWQGHGSAAARRTCRRTVLPRAAVPRRSLGHRPPPGPSTQVKTRCSPRMAEPLAGLVVVLALATATRMSPIRPHLILLALPEGPMALWHRD